jgi:tRNA (adenine22-N1)-methyltransferase
MSKTSLDPRLQAVFDRVRATVHADIGSDHGNLTVELLRAGRIERGIAIDNKRLPFQNSCAALSGMNADVRLADGLAGLNPGEADSMSICGLGGRSIVKIFETHPDRISNIQPVTDEVPGKLPVPSKLPTPLRLRVPVKLIVQPNKRPETVRAWAMRNGFHLVDEEIIEGHWPYNILEFAPATGRDPAYVIPNDDSWDLETALFFGPHNLQRSTDALKRWILDEQRFLEKLPHRNEAAQRKYLAVKRWIHRNS